MLASPPHPNVARIVPGSVLVLSFTLYASCALAQTAPVSPDHPGDGPDEKVIKADAKNLRESAFDIDPIKTYTLPELVDLAESHNPETRVAWERARTQAAAWAAGRNRNSVIRDTAEDYAEVYMDMLRLHGMQEPSHTFDLIVKCLA